jgi:hypothetical protein
MTKMNQWFMTAVAATALCLGASSVFAQSNNSSNNNRNGNNDSGNRRSRGNSDPSQMQQQIMERIKEQFEITDDAEWKAIQPKIQKVMDLRRDLMSNMGRGMFGRRFGGGDSNSGDSGRPRGGGFFGPPSPETEALQKAVEGKASNSEMKAVIAKYQEARKAKTAELEKAQADLRAVLSVRQEAQATLDGLL